MIRVCTGSAHHINCLIHIKAFILCENADQLRNHHRRMGIINLYHSIIREVIQITSLGTCLINNQLGSIAYHEILLVNAQQLSLIVTVIRIQKQC